MLNAPINLYFDKTTSGVVLKRFNVDLQKATKDLPEMFTWNFHDICRISITISIIATFDTALLITILIIVIFYFSYDAVTSYVTGFQKLRQVSSNQNYAKDFLFISLVLIFLL